MDSIYSAKRCSDSCWETALLLALINEKNISFSLMFNCNLAMFSIQCHYYWEKDITFISHSFKNMQTEQHKKELLILTKSCPFFLDFLSSMGNNRVPPNSRSVQKTRTEQNQKISPEESTGSRCSSDFTVMFCIIPLGFLDLLMMVSALRPFAQGRKTDVTLPKTHTRIPVKDHKWKERHWNKKKASLRKLEKPTGPP